jgi:hypothetical protein
MVVRVFCSLECSKTTDILTGYLSRSVWNTFLTLHESKIPYSMRHEEHIVSMKFLFIHRRSEWYE